jgi:hypothetical protein
MSLRNEELLERHHEMKKLYHEIEKEEKEREEFENRLLAIIDIAGFVGAVTGSFQMLVSNDDVSILNKITTIAIAAFACTMAARSCFQSMKELRVSIYESISDLMIQLLCNRIDEEGQGYLSDLKSEWINLELSQKQIKIKELMFIIDRYWGRFIAWMRLPRFSAFTRIR